MASDLYKSKAFLYRRYIVEHKTLAEIGKECGVSAQTINVNLKKQGLK